MNIVTAAQVVLGQPDSNPTGGPPPLALVLTLFTVIAIVVAGSLLVMGVEAYRLAAGAIGSLVAGVFRLSVVVALLLGLVVFAVIREDQDSRQAPGAGTTATVPSQPPVAPLPRSGRG